MTGSGDFTFDPKDYARKTSELRSKQSLRSQSDHNSTASANL
jgi:hypothetical protein